MPTYSFPSNTELGLIAQKKIPNLVKNRPAFKIMPIVNVDAALLEWEQKDNYLGLQQFRGVNGAPPRVKRIGANKYIQTPGVYGEYTSIDELELLHRRPWGKFNGNVDVSDLVMECQDQLLGRRLDRIEYIIWTLLSTGTFSVPGPDGGVVHTDTFTLQTASASVVWATAATATPLADFRAVQLLSRGFSVNFGSSATAYMNRATWNNFIKNTNAADFGGKKGMGLSSISSIGDSNRILTDEGLPNMEIFDGGYLDDAGAFQLFIPNNKVIVIGSRNDGSPLGEYRMVRNIVNDNMEPGAYMETIDRGSDGPGKQIPRVIEVHDGHNGGPVIYFGSGIVILTV